MNQLNHLQELSNTLHQSVKILEGEMLYTFEQLDGLKAIVEGIEIIPEYQSIITYIQSELTEAYKLENENKQTINELLLLAATLVVDAMFDSVELTNPDNLIPTRLTAMRGCFAKVKANSRKCDCHVLNICEITMPFITK